MLNRTLPQGEQEKETDTDGLSSVTAAVRKAAAGERQAFEGLINRFQGEIFKMVYYRTMSRMDAEDITQDVFLNAFRKVNTLKEPEMFRPWLYRIAVNSVRDYYRRKRVRSIFTWFTREQDEGQVPAPECDQDNLEKKEFWGRLESFLSRLSASEKEVFRLRFLDDLSIREITAALGKNESTVKTHLYRAVEKFRSEQDIYNFLQEGKL